MSAIAIIVQQKESIFLSDGLQVIMPEKDLHKQIEDVDYQSWEEHSRDSSKLIKINDRVCVTWIGRIIPSIEDNFKQVCTDNGCTEPKEIARTLSRLLKEHHEGQDISKMGGTPRNVNITVTGYDKQGTPWGINLNCSREFEPKSHKLVADDKRTSITAALPFVDAGRDEFMTYLKKHRHEKYGTVENQAIAAFTDMIRKYEKKGHMVGGKIFVEQIRPN